MTAPAGPNVSPILRIAIVSYHSPLEELNRAVESLSGALQELASGEKSDQEIPSAEIVIIDNSEEGLLRLDQFAYLAETLQELNSELRLIQGQGNVGYGKAHNLALRNSGADFHLIMNSDVVLDTHALKVGIAYLQSNPQVAVVSPAAQDGSGTKQYLCKQYPSVLNFFLRGFMPGIVQALFRGKLSRYEMRSLPETSPSTDIPIVSGCFMLGRTQALQEVNGFDEAYFLYFEDFDLSMRLNQRYQLAYLPDMKIVHDGGNAAGKGSRHIGMFIRSGRRFFSTWGWRFI